MDDIHPIIEAFVDNELVDPAQLRDALASVEGREYLVDLLVLRGFVGADPDTRAKLSAERAAAPRASRRWLSVAAAVALVSVAGGYYAGQQSAPANVTGRADSAVNAPAPEPTRVIRLDESADWVERVGED